MSILSKTHLALAMFAVTIFLLAYLSPVSYTSSDPTYTLLTSQALVEYGTIKIDDYKPDLGSVLDSDARLKTVNNHTYYFFPIGTSLFVTPIVWVANWFGLDMRNVEDDAWLQNLISALISVALFFIIYRICIYYLSPENSVLLAAIVVLGTALISTIGTALWNLGSETLFILLGLWLLIRLEHNGANRADPYILGILLFAAFLSRPTAVIFIIMALLFIAFRQRSYFIKTAVTALILLSLFVVFSKGEYGTWLPPYYIPGRLGTGDTPFILTLYGLLFSPSRGIFVFSPMFLVVATLLIILAFKMRFRLPLLLWFGVVWFFCAVLSVSRFGHWWGGHSYGPRLLTDVVPALILITIASWHLMRTKLSERTSHWLTALFLILATVSVAINSFAGLFNSQTIRWNGDMLSPNIDRAPQYLFSWHYPQFLANEELICSRNKDYFKTSLAAQRIVLSPYQLGQPVAPQEAQLAMHLAPGPNWFLPTNWKTQDQNERKHIASGNKIYLPAIFSRWPISTIFVGFAYQKGESIDTLCNPANIIVGPAAFAGKDRDLLLKLTMGTNTPENIYASLNGTPPEALSVDKQSMVAELAISALDLLPDQPNWITLTFSDQEISGQEFNGTILPAIKALSIEDPN
ncbi:MAG: hypothetical protein GWP61_00415 [Chloroflexi bacterium]|jgi:hypothetical protein|nr:hypothetical protein [Chloroflexota bacterium]